MLKVKAISCLASTTFKQNCFQHPSLAMTTQRELIIPLLFLVIQEESTESRAEVKSFDHGKLKHVETAEKNPLPTQADIKEELRPDTLPDVSAVKDFDTQKLKHVETEEKNVMPTADGK